MNCSRLYLLSTLACELSNCLPENELNKLSTDLVVLSDMLSHLIAHKDDTDTCKDAHCQTCDDLHCNLCHAETNIDCN